MKRESCRQNGLSCPHQNEGFCFLDTDTKKMDQPLRILSSQLGF